jgi:hypothetical protein
MKKYILAILTIALLVAISYAANVKNYFIQPGKDGDNALYITGTENVSGTLNITGILNASSATTSFGSITASTATITNTASVKVIDFAVNLDTTTAPSSTGIVGLTSGFKMYVSTGTAAGSWQLVGSQS